jgi:hypothetical protein
METRVFLSDIIIMIESRTMRWRGHVARMGKKKKKKTCRVLVGKPKGKRPLERPRHRLGG